MSESGIDEPKSEAEPSIVRSSDDEADSGLVMSPFRQSNARISTTPSGGVGSGHRRRSLDNIFSDSPLPSRYVDGSKNSISIDDAGSQSGGGGGSSSSSNDPKSPAWSIKSSSSRLSRISLEEARNRSYLVGSLSRGSLLGAEQLDAHFPTRSIHIFAGTWNANCTSDAPLNLDEFLLPRECGIEDLPEIYIIGTQENVMPRNEWETALQEVIGLTHVLFRSAVLGTLHLAVFIRRELLWFCSEPEFGNIATRQGSAIKTKGAVALAFRLFGTSFLFINSHLTAHYQNVKERINDYLKIRRGLEFPYKVNPTNRPPLARVIVPSKDVTSNFDNVFWLGDLNFRLEVERKHLMDMINGQDFNYEMLLKADQLLNTMAQGEAFNGFSEANVQFLPTFKFDVGSNRYDTSNKCRTPAYTDRILFRTRKKDSISCINYNSASNILVSDHKPVYAIFKVKLRPGRDDIPLAAGHYVRSVYLKALEKRALQMDPLHKEYESRFCSLM